MRAGEVVVDVRRPGEPDEPRPASPTGERPRRRWLPHPAVSVVLLVVWLALVNDLHPRMVLLGVVWAVAIPLLTQSFLPDKPRVRSWRTLLRFLPVFLWDVLVANIAVAALILNFRRRVRPAWIVIPLDIHDPYAITTLANVISLTPGTVSAEVGQGRTTLLVHALDVSDPDAEVARIKRRYEAPIKEIFE